MLVVGTFQFALPPKWLFNKLVLELQTSYASVGAKPPELCVGSELEHFGSASVQALTTNVGMDA
ncbi:MAG TPA: hypothetical protein DD001_16895 [Microcoleaceae bacterium UBA10368]|jgi:hypothetical protein|nr:hypothetical protein [Microcoleaceae cyanobacterium UBA10368]